MKGECDKMKTQINYRKNIVRAIHYHKHRIKYLKQIKLNSYDDGNYNMQELEKLQNELDLLQELLKDN